MFVKLVSPDKKESRMIRAVDGYPGLIWGKVNTLDDLDDFGEHLIEFYVDGPPYRYVEFIPAGDSYVKLAVTSGRIYIEGDDGQNIESVN